MIYVYIDHRAKSPFLSFLEDIKQTDRAMYHKTLELLEEMKNDSLRLERPRVKTMLARTKLRQVYKIRLGQYRLFFLVKNHHYYLLHAFKKTSQTTPEKEIKQLKKEVKQQTFIPLPM